MKKILKFIWQNKFTILWWSLLPIFAIIAIIL